MIKLTDANGLTLYVDYDQITHFTPAAFNGRWYSVLSRVFLRNTCLDVRESMDDIAQQLTEAVLCRIAH